MACVVCHEPQSVSKAAQADNWITKPSREACGSCHDDVNFATGENHADLPQISDNQCARCHVEQGELDFDTSIRGAHVVPTESAFLPGVVFTIESAADVAPGKRPTVTFTIKDKDGNPTLPSQMSTLRLYMAGPTGDFGSYVREDALRATGANGRYTYTFTAAIPNNATGTYQFGIEGYRNINVLEGTKKQRAIRSVGANKIFIASVDGSAPEPRRALVSSKKCNSCHYSLSFHGGNRNQAEMCAFCHNPNLVEGAQNESWNYMNMIHRFHAEEVRYPGRITNCTQCHEGTSYMPVDRDNAMPVKNGMAPLNPTPAITNACTSCHVESAAFRHAQANTSALGESCTVCHAGTAEFSVSKVHAQ
jgi:OmcA/MtrC family decaheme c-type cytochrome